MNQEDKIQLEDNEIDLMDYVIVILKRKWLVFGIFLLVVIVAFIFSSFAEKIYKIDTSLEIGKVGAATIEEPIQMIEKPLQIKEKIDNDIYGVLIREKLGIEERYPKTKVENPTGTNLVQIKIESSNTQKAKNILEEMNNLILAEHQEKIKAKIELIEKNIKTTESKIEIEKSNIEKVKNKRQSSENDIQRIRNKINSLNEDIETTRNKIEPIRNDIKRIENKINNAKEEKKNLEAKVDALEETLVYEQTPGTQFALFDAKEKLANKKQEIENLYLSINSLERTIEDYNLQISSLERSIEDYNLQISSLERGLENYKIEINSLENTIESYYAQINSLKASLSNIKATRVVKSPTISKFPIKPRKRLNMAIAGILGLFLGVFLAFGLEWWQRSKTR